MACDRFTKPIAGSGETLTFPESSSSLDDLSVTLDVNMGRVIIDVDGDPNTPSVVGRFWETGQDPTSSEGNSIQSGEQMEFTKAQAEGLKVFAIGGTFVGQLTQYESEDV